MGVVYGGSRYCCEYGSAGSLSYGRAGLVIATTGMARGCSVELSSFDDHREVILLTHC